MPDLRPEVVLLDADGNLFPSEEPAFAASCAVTNDFLASLGSEVRFDAAELQEAALGRNFRAMAQELAAQADLQVPAGELDEWVRREQDAVTQHLSEVLAPDPLVRQVVQSLRARYRLAVVSSSALARLDACLRATGLVEWLPMEQCFSAQDSLPTPTSKPDPAVYLAAVAALEVDASRAVAVEDAVAGVRSAVDAGIPVVGNLAFVPSDQQDAREAQLLAAGAEAVVRDWRELAEAFGVASPADSLA